MRQRIPTAPRFIRPVPVGAAGIFLAVATGRVATRLATGRRAGVRRAAVRGTGVLPTIGGLGFGTVCGEPPAGRGGGALGVGGAVVSSGTSIR
jgi:hypothetical protein